MLVNISGVSVGSELMIAMLYLLCLRLILVTIEKAPVLARDVWIWRISCARVHADIYRVLSSL